LVGAAHINRLDVQVCFQKHSLTEASFLRPQVLLSLQPLTKVCI